MFVFRNFFRGWALERTEVVRWVAAGITSHPTRTFYIILRWIFESSCPPPSIAGHHRTVGGVQERPGPAGEVSHAQVRHGPLVRPVGLHSRDGEFGQQDGRRGQRVECREEFPVLDQLLKQPSAEVMLARGAEVVNDVFGHIHEALQHILRNAVRDMRQDFRSDAEDRIVVYLIDDVVPCLQHLAP